jgi:pimeloyl-ACP methyl ester carboxylesterase
VNATGQGSQQTDMKPTIVLVHGAFADASSWNGVIERLQQQGYTVIVPANPLRGVTADSAYIASLLGQIDGPVLLGGHSYGGAVITNAATGAPNVVGLVYVAAFAPDEGENLGDVENGSRDSVLNAALVQYTYPAGPGGQTSVEFAINPARVREAFAADLPEQTIALIGATQRPIAAAGADVVRSHAQRAGADIVEVEGSHVIMISQPQTVTDHILKAARAVADSHR